MKEKEYNLEQKKLKFTTLYERLKLMSIEDMATTLSEMTWVCGDCSPDNQNDCVKCIQKQLSRSLRIEV